VGDVVSYQPVGETFIVFNAASANCEFCAHTGRAHGGDADPLLPQFPIQGTG
jgi:hypothetical protein